MPYTVLIPIEPVPGGSSGIAFTSASAQWERLDKKYCQGGTVRLPADQFRYDKAVPDQRRFVWKGGQLLPAPANGSVRPGAVVIVLESPHQHEYTPGFKPVAPLQKPASQTRLRNQLPRLLREAGVSDDVDVVLANPIQYQTSLHRLMRPEYQAGISATVRDAVWKALWSHPVNGVPVYQHEFLARMGSYQPSLVINACTAGVKDLVTNLLKAHGYPVVGVTQHPSYWSSKTKFVP